MAIAQRPSKITLPAENKGWNSILDFLVAQFPLINKSIWLTRLEQGKVHWLDGKIIDIHTAFKASAIVCYYREVELEPNIPFEHTVIYQDKHILVACKPHYLPVTPGGQYVNECLLERLRQQLDLPDLVATHRLDRETAGLVLFSINAKSRADYCQLFAEHKITKTYQAVAKLSPAMKAHPLPHHWKISNRLVKSKPTFLMRETDQNEGAVNAHSEISLIARNDQLGLFELKPITGKTHQLRLHMQKIGAPILNDSFYPTLLPKQALTFKTPLQLLAKHLQFIDPLTGELRVFESTRRLPFWINKS